MSDLSDNRRLRWGILGAGRIAGTYATAIGASENGEVVAVGSRDRAKAAAFARQHGIATAHGSYGDLLADPGVDAVYVALPNGLHAEWSIRAAAAGKHVLCEKPLAANAAEGAAMKEAFAGRGLLLAEALMYRRHPVNRMAVGLLHEGRIGPLVAMNATFYCGAGGDDAARLSAALAGGALRDIGSYCVSLLRWAARAEPAAAVARGVENVPGGVDVQMAGVLHFPGGVLGAFGCGYELPFVCRYELIGRDGRIVADGGPLCAWPTGEFTINVWTGDRREDIAVPPANHYQLMAEEFAAAVLDGRPPAWPIDDALANLAVLDQLRAAAGIGG